MFILATEHSLTCRFSKFPTISKIPPSGDEVEGFIALVVRLREEQKERAVAEGWSEHCIGVHCHYGESEML